MTTRNIGLRLFLSIPAVLLATACSGGTAADAGSGVAEGASCKSFECATGLFCFTKTKDNGLCTKIPASCPSSLKCGDSCFDAIKATCGDAGTSGDAGFGSSMCVSISGLVSLSCGLQ